MFKKVLKWLGVLLAVLVVAIAGGLYFLKRTATAKLEKHYDIEVSAIPIPFPLTEDEIASLRRPPKPAAAAPAAPAKTDAPVAAPGETPTPTGEVPIANPNANVAVPPAAPVPAEGTPAAATSPAPAMAAAPPQELSTLEIAKQMADDPLRGVSLEMLAMRRAVARGKRYLETRAGCPECHGADLGGHTILDNPAMGLWNGPNITRGGVTKDYTSEDWVRIIRHGVKKDGKAALMPCQDFTWFSDQEVSDIAAYIRSVPAVDRVMPPYELGPIFWLIITKGDWKISAETLDHTTPRPKYPPAIVAGLDLGKHLAATCQGCHGHGYAGGPIIGGDPKWPPARNLTFHDTGLGAWQLADFTKALREGVRPNGEKIDAKVMPIAYTQKLKDAEIEALYLYFQSVEKKPYGSH